MAKIKAAIGICLGLLATLTLVATAVYTGPDRSETRIVWERKDCHYQAVYDPPGPGSYGCFLDLYFPPTSGCPTNSSIASYFNPAVCSSWPGSCADLSCNISGSESVAACISGEMGCTSREESYSLPNASVSGVATCLLPGENGWCRGEGILSLSSHEPLAGYAITGIEGPSGVLCSGSSCQWSFPEGDTATSFWALSSYGDTSLASSASMRVDTVPPTAALTISGGNPNSNGWYNQPAGLLMTVVGDDSTSGAADHAVQVNGGIWQSSPRSFPGEGIYEITGRVSDLAGNQAFTSSQLVRIDGTPPDLIAQADRDPDHSGWYLSPVEISARGEDTLSGLDSLEAHLQNPEGVETQVSLPVVISDEGKNTLLLKAVDLAGNTRQLSRSVQLDLTAPTIHMSVEDAPGANGWYTHPITATFSGQDAASGLLSLELREAAGTWEPRTQAVFSLDGRYTLSARAVDQAGWEAEQDFTFWIDQTPPQFTPEISGLEGGNGWYTGPVTLRANATDATAGLAKVLPSDEILLTDSGLHWVTWTATDLAGNSSIFTLDNPLRIDVDLPLVSLDPLPGLLLGTVTLSGSALDEGAGIARVQLSTAGGADFQDLSLEDSGRWSYSWNTDSSPAGPHIVVLRATDLAGNETELRVETTLARIPPAITLDPFWKLGRQGRLTLIPGDAPLSRLVVQICALATPGQCELKEYAAEDFPQAVSWEGTFSGVQAPAGEYAVRVTLQDSLGREAIASGRILIPSLDPHPLVPTLVALLSPLRQTPWLTPTSASTQTIMSTAGPVIEKTPFPLSTTAARQDLAASAVEVSTPHRESQSAGHLLLPLFLVFFLVSLVTDPRLRALRRVTTALRNLIQSQKEHYD